MSVVGLGFGLEKKFSLLSVSFRSVLDRKIVIFGLFMATTIFAGKPQANFGRKWHMPKILQFAFCYDYDVGNR